MKIMGESGADKGKEKGETYRSKKVRWAGNDGARVTRHLCGFPATHTDEHFLQLQREDPWLQLGFFLNPR